jgi:hypothetical protein
LLQIIYLKQQFSGKRVSVTWVTSRFSQPVTLAAVNDEDEGREVARNVD